MTEPSTPLMRQYSAIKKEHPSALLFFRLGDFYEMFFDDAVVAAKELQITLTSRNKEKGAAIPMCGVPFHAAEGYISKLIRRGYKVAICDQMEDARLAKKLVRREVTRVVTPGTAAGAALNSDENNFLAAVVSSGERSGSTSQPASFAPPSFLATERSSGSTMNWSNCARKRSYMPARRRCSKPPLVSQPHPSARQRAGPRLRSMTGCSLPTTPFPCLKTTSGSFHSKASASPASLQPRRQRAQFFTMCDPHSGARSTMSIASDFTSGKAPWCSMRSRCATSSWSNRYLPEAIPESHFFVLST
jgi:hypothetical protein